MDPEASAGGLILLTATAGVDATGSDVSTLYPEAWKWRGEKEVVFEKV